MVVVVVLAPGLVGSKGVEVEVEKESCELLLSEGASVGVVCVVTDSDELEGTAVDAMLV